MSYRPDSDGARRWCDLVFGLLLDANANVRFAGDKILRRITDLHPIVVADFFTQEKILGIIPQDLNKQVHVRCNVIL